MHSLLTFMKRSSSQLFSFVWIVMSVVPVWPDAGMALHLDEQQLTATFQDRPLLVYRYAKVPAKPYVQQLYTLDGRNVIRDNVPDHPHHHGLMFAVSANETTYWEESDTAGKQIHQSFSQTTVDPPTSRNRAQFSEQLIWKNAEGKIQLHETRSITVQPLVDKHAVFIRWNSFLTCPDSLPSVNLSGHHYYGLGMRFPAAWDAVGTFSNEANQEGRIFRGEERLLEAPWCAYSVKTPSPATVCMFDLPANPRPVTWFTMANPFAYLSATLLYHEKPVRITTANPLNVTYAVVVFDTNPPRKSIQELYRRWVQKQER